MSNRRFTTAVAVGVSGLFAAPAFASVLASMTYNDLEGTYTQSSPGVGVFNAGAVDKPALRSWGSVSRVVPTVGDAIFNPGFVSGLNPADFQLSMNVNVTGPSTAAGVGTFTCTDADGDQIVGTISDLTPGSGWTTPGFGIFFYNGVLSNVYLYDNGPQDGLFNGTDGGSWAMNLPGTPPFDGAIVSLVFNFGGGFFDANFTDAATSLTAQIVPAPGAAALLGVAGLVAARRRRA